MSNNRDIYTEHHLYLSAPHFILDEKKLYFSNRSCNALVIVDRETWNVESMIPFVGEALDARELHVACCRQGDKIYFLPQGKKKLHVYDMKSGEQRAYELKGEYDDRTYALWDFHIWNNKIYLLPCGGGFGLWSLDFDGQLNKESWWEVYADTANIFMHGAVDEQRFFSLRKNTGEFTITDLQKRETKTYRFSDERSSYAAYDGQDFWYITYDTADIVRWNPEDGERERYSFPIWDKCTFGGVPYTCIYAAGAEIFVVSGTQKELFVLDKEKRVLKPIFQLQGIPNCYREADMAPFFTRLGDKLIWAFRSAGGAAVIDLTTMGGQMCHNVIPLNDKVRDRFDQTLFLKSPLLFEESDGWNLEKFLHHCMCSADSF